MGDIQAPEERQVVVHTQVQLDLQVPQVHRDYQEHLVLQEHQEHLVTQALKDIQDQEGNQVAEVILAVGDILLDRDHQEHQEHQVTQEYREAREVPVDQEAQVDQEALYTQVCIREDNRQSP